MSRIPRSVAGVPGHAVIVTPEAAGASVRGCAEADFVRVAWAWFRLVRRGTAIERRVDADPLEANDLDTALTPASDADAGSVVAAFADRIPATHGAPARRPAA